MNTKQQRENNIRLNSSIPPLVWKCLAPRTTAMGLPVLSNPWINILFCAISCGSSDAEIEPFGTKVCLHFKYLRNKAEAFSTFKSRARRNLLIIRSSTTCLLKHHISKYQQWKWNLGVAMSSSLKLVNQYIYVYAWKKD